MDEEANEYCQHTTEKVYVLAPYRDFSIYVDIENNEYLYTPNPLKVCTVHNEFTYDPYIDYETEPTETDIVTE